MKIWDTLSQDGSVFQTMPLDYTTAIKTVSITEEGADLATISNNGEIRVLAKNIDNLSTHRNPKNNSVLMPVAE
jgi:hypothetical protein